VTLRQGNSEGAEVKKSLLVAIAILCIQLAAQTAPDSAPAKKSPSKLNAAQSAFLQQLMDARQRREQRLQENRANVDRMRGMLEKMRADAAKMQDENARSVAMGNIELWQMQLDTMQRNLDANREAMQKRNEMMKQHQKPGSEDQEKPK
jgi:hypothetical protein